jgi:hypothetical protein
MCIGDYTIAPQVRADFGALVWYLSYRHDVPLPNPAQDLYLFDGAKTAIESEVTAADVRRHLMDMPVVAELDDGVLDHLAAHGSIDRYRRDETILAQGGRRDLVLLHAGRAGLLLRAPDLDDLAVLDIEPGEILTVVDEPTETDRDVLITAVTDCEVVRIPPDAAAQAVALAPELAALLQQLATTQRRRIDRIVRRRNRATPGEIGPAADELHTQDDDST